MNHRNASILLDNEIDLLERKKKRELEDVKWAYPTNYIFKNIPITLILLIIDGSSCCNDVISSNSRFCK